MEKIKKTARWMMLLAVMILLTACGKHTPDESGVRMPVYDENGFYIGFFDIEKDSDVDKAKENGCYVINDGELYGGKDAWEAFCRKAEAGEDAFLRIAHLIVEGNLGTGTEDTTGTMYYSDLYFYDGKYYFFDYNGADDIRKSGPFTYLRELTGMFGNPLKEHSMFVLTDSLELTYEEVQHSFYSSNLETVTKIPFTWLGFTVYLREE